MNKTVKWTAAIVFSLAAHAGAAVLLMPGETLPDNAVEGGQAMEVAVLGNSFEDALASGSPSEEITPIETPSEVQTPVEPETSTQALAPETVPDVVSEVAPDLAPSDADVILPADSIPPMTAEAPEVVASLPPVATVVPEEKPETKPEPVQKAEPKKPEPKKKPAPKTVTERPKAGDNGARRETTRAGRDDGKAAGGADTAKNTTGPVARQAGNAAFSRYSGKVRAKLDRAFRYPSEARRAGLRGTAQVRLTVNAGGGVTGASIIRSAGSPILDRAALEAVARAAPFPKIPDEVGRSSISFTIPLAFTR